MRASAELRDTLMLPCTVRHRRWLTVHGFVFVFFVYNCAAAFSGCNERRIQEAFIPHPPSGTVQPCRLRRSGDRHRDGKRRSSLGRPCAGVEQERGRNCRILTLIMCTNVIYDNRLCFARGCVEQNSVSVE